MPKRKLVLPFVLLCLAALGVWAAGAAIMSVQVRQSEIRSSPSGLAGVVASVKLGDPLTVIEERGAWTKVSTAGGATGWIPTTSLVQGTIRVRSGGKDAQAGASSDEMSLATKGFTSQVEADFKNQHKDIDFTWVDKMIRIKIAAEEMRAFLKEGLVQPGKGGAQ